jgi:hypothetical protein
MRTEQTRKVDSKIFCFEDSWKGLDGLVQLCAAPAEDWRPQWEGRPGWNLKFSGRQPVPPC